MIPEGNPKGLCARNANAEMTGIWIDACPLDPSANEMYKCDRLVALWNRSKKEASGPLAGRILPSCIRNAPRHT